MLSLASSMCWILTDPEDATKGYTHRLTPDEAFSEIEPAIKGLMLAVQRKMDLTFPAHLIKNIARLEIEKEISVSAIVIFFPTFVIFGMLRFVLVPSGKPLDTLWCSVKNVGESLIMNKYYFPFYHMIKKKEQRISTFNLP